MLRDLNMNLSKELILPIITTYVELAREEDRTWCVTLYPKTQPWSGTDMRDVISVFRAKGYKEDVHEEVLEVYDEAELTLLRVSGIHNISNYCHNENPKAAKGSWFRHARVEPEDSIQFPDIFSLRVVSSVEEERSLGDMETPQGWGSSMKMHTMRKSIVYTDMKTGVKYCLCMVKRATDPATTMIKSNVSSKPAVIEYSIEVPPALYSKQPEGKAKAPESEKEREDIGKEVMTMIVKMLQMVEQNKTPITVDQQKQVLQAYNALVKKVRDARDFKDSFYLAPKPYTIEQVHLSDPGLTYGQLSILDGYAVTDKADGERMLMYIDDVGDAYLINNAFEVRGTGLKARRDLIHNTLLDGEFLPPSKRLDGVERDLFAIFDIYFVGGESVMGLPLIDTGTHAIQAVSIQAPASTSAKGAEKAKITGRSRVEVISTVLESHLWEPSKDKDVSVQMVAKQHIAAKGEDMFKACREILTNATRKGTPYDIDGLIFTPTDLPVLGVYPGKAVTIKGSSTTWDRVLKWKPHDQNSIDFVVSLDKTPIVDHRTRRSYAKLLLSCGYSALKNEEISVSRGLQLLQTRISERNLKDVYILKAFTPQYKYQQGVQFAYIPYSADGTIVAANGDEIHDGSVVEFSYDPNDQRPVSYRWHPMRVRNDKMRNTVTPAQDAPEKKGRHQISTNKANDWKTATSIWKSIHEPVTREMITGVVRAPQLVKKALNLQARLLGTDAVYYGRNIAREHLLSVGMLNFHNTVVKDNLYKWPIGMAKTSLLELACGMAGDLGRWQDPNTGFAFRNVLGVDLVRDNITKAMDGAYARVLKPFRYGVQRKHQNYVFAIGDCAKPLATGEASRGMDKDSEDVLLELFGKRSSRRLLTSIPRFGRDKFDMVSCQFSIHYFFETEEKFRGFLANVRDNLRPGGVFITTFMDGKTVERLLQEEGRNGLVEGRKLDGRVVVWAIRNISQVATDAESPEEEADAVPIAGVEPVLEPEAFMMGGAPARRSTKLMAYEEDKSAIKEYRLVDVPAEGDCMFISLELAAFGEEKSKNRDGTWMRSKVIDKMREILSRPDETATELYEELRIHIDNMSSSVKEEASEMIGKESLYSTEESDAPYEERADGYLEWMSTKGVWGTGIELRMAMEFLERPVFIYQTDKKTKRAQAHTIGENRFPNKPPVRVWFNGINHYKAVLEKPGAPAMPTVPSVPSMPSLAAPVAAPAPKLPVEKPKFGRIIDVYLENINRLIPEYLVDFEVLTKYADEYGLELEHDSMFSDTYQEFKKQNPDTTFQGFDDAKETDEDYAQKKHENDVQKKFSFLNRWAVFKRRA